MYRVMHITVTSTTRHTIDGVDIEPPEEDTETRYSIVSGNRLVCRIEVEISPEQADAIDAAVRKLDATDDGCYGVRRRSAVVVDGISKELAEAIRDALGSETRVEVFSF